MEQNLSTLPGRFYKYLLCKEVYNILMWKTRNLSTFPSFPHKNVILFLSEGKVYTFPAKSKKNLYTFPAKCILFPLSVKRISILLRFKSPSRTLGHKSKPLLTIWF